MDEREIEYAVDNWFVDRPITRRACIEVIRRLPEDVANEVMYSSNLVVFAPAGEWGRTLPLTLPGYATETQRTVERSSGDVTSVKVTFVYLAPELEKQEYSVIVAVVAHEIEHAILRDIMGDESERAADEKMVQWGFSAELDELRKANPRHRY